MLFLILSIVLYLLGIIITARFAIFMSAEPHEVVVHSALWPYIAIQILIHSIFKNNDECED